MTRRTRIEQLRAKAKRQNPSDGVSSGGGGQPGQQPPPGISDSPGGNGGQGTQPTQPPGQGVPPGGQEGTDLSDQPTATASPGDNSSSPDPTQSPGDGSGNGNGTGNGNGDGTGNGNGNGGNGDGNGNGNGGGNDNGNGGGMGNGSGPAIPGLPGSGSGTVSGPGSGRHGLSPAAIAAILLSILLVLAVLALAGRLLWRRYRERRRAGLRAFHRPQLYSQTSFQYDPQMAERLRGGLIDPYTGAASAETLPSQYRIEPFAVPPRRPPHVRANSSTRLLDDPGVIAMARDEKRGPSPLPRGAMNLAHHGHTFSELENTPFPTPGSEEEMVFELPPTYASLNAPQPMRRWYQFWQSPS